MLQVMEVCPYSLQPASGRIASLEPAAARFGLQRVLRLWREPWTGLGEAGRRWPAWKAAEDNEHTGDEFAVG